MTGGYLFEQNAVKVKNVATSGSSLSSLSVLRPVSNLSAFPPSPGYNCHRNTSSQDHIAERLANDFGFVQRVEMGFAWLEILI
jgi:hypothetical protein